MLIYGLMLMGGCMLVGLFIGDLLGYFVSFFMEGFSGNIGGVGFAMLFLIIITQKLNDKGKFSKAAESGIKFWSNFYIPVVVAMSATQNVSAAAKGGVVAVLAGVGCTLLMFIFIRPLTRMMGPQDPLPPAEKS